GEHLLDGLLCGQLVGLGLVPGHRDFLMVEGMDLPKLVEQFSSEERCRAYLEELRWPGGPECPRCEEPTTISKLASRNQYECDSCKYQFSVTAGTLFHDSHL